MHIRALVSLLALLALLAASLPAQARPNILLIVVDDQSPFDLKAYAPDTACRTPVPGAEGPPGSR